MNVLSVRPISGSLLSLIDVFLNVSHRGHAVHNQFFDKLHKTIFNAEVCFNVKITDTALPENLR